MIKLSIAICTFNRSKILDLCLDSIANQNYYASDFEVLIVDSNSTEDLQIIKAKYESKIKNLHLIKVAKSGLSHARNIAIKESKGEWIAYIDDDALLLENYITNTFKIIEGGKFDAFGGNIYPKFLIDRPNWIKKDFGGIIFESNKIIELNEPSMLFGVNMIFRKAVLKKTGGFLTNLGMNSDKIGYGEETEVIQRILSLKYKIGIVPEIGVMHLVLPHKLTIKWHLKTYIEQGKAWEFINSTKNSKFDLILHFVVNILKKIVTIPILIIKLKKKDFYWQNFILELSYSILFYIGRLKEKFNF